MPRNMWSFRAYQTLSTNIEKQEEEISKVLQSGGQEDLIYLMVWKLEGDKGGKEPKSVLLANTCTQQEYLNLRHKWGCDLYTDATYTRVNTVY